MDSETLIYLLARFPLPIVILCISGPQPTSSLVTLEIVELRQEWMSSDPSGMNHSLNVVLLDHDHIDDDATWTFVFIDEEQSSHDCTTTNTDQTDLICEGNLENATYIMMVTRDSNNGDTVGIGYTEITIEGNEFCMI